MKTLLKLALQINGTVNHLKYGKNKDKGYCITDKDKNEILTVSPSYGTGFKWCVINRNRFHRSEIIFVNSIRELKDVTLNEGFNGSKFVS
jgi:hypothetical protein